MTLGYRVWVKGLGSGVLCFEFGDSGYMITRLGFGVQGSGRGVQSSGLWVLPAP